MSDAPNSRGLPLSPMADVPSSRGRALPRKGVDEETVRAVIADTAQALCGLCGGDLLGWWAHCPKCGAWINWSEATGAGDQTSIG
jgi:hypothetical protein